MAEPRLTLAYARQVLGPKATDEQLERVVSRVQALCDLVAEVHIENLTRQRQEEPR